MARRLVTLSVFLCAAFALMATPALALRAAALNPAGTELIRFDTTAPGTITERHAITGLQPNEKILGLDSRPANTLLYGLGIAHGATDTGRIYVIDPDTGAASAVGAAPFKTDLKGGEYGFDIDPSTDTIRVVNRLEDNVRVNPTTGALVQADTDLPSGDVDALAYDQNVAGTGQTTLWGYDSGIDKVVRVGGVNSGPPEGSPNDGAVVAPYGASGVSTAGRAEMDFSPGGTAFLTAATAGPTYSLYKVNLSDGTLGLVGNFPEALDDLALLLGAGPLPPDTKKPQVLLSTPTLISSARARALGVAGSFSCSEGCKASFTLKFGKRTLGTAKATLTAAGVKRFRVRLSGKGKNALRARFKTRRKIGLVLRVNARDAAGNVGKASAKVTATR